MGRRRPGGGRITWTRRWEVGERAWIVRVWGRVLILETPWVRKPVGKRTINHTSCTVEKRNTTVTHAFWGGPCDGLYDGAYPEWKGGGASLFMGVANPPLGIMKKTICVTIRNEDGEKR